MTRPFGDTNEPEPPLLKRTDDFITWLYQSGPRSKPYFSLSCRFGGLLKSHMPSSGRTDGVMNKVPAKATVPTVASRANRIMRKLLNHDVLIRVMAML